MKKKSAKQVPLPNINATAEADFAARQKSSDAALLANRSNQVNPYGSIDWSRDPVSGEWTQTEAYNPGQQALYDTELTNKGTMGKMAGGLLGEMDLHLNKAPEMPTVGGYDQRAIDTIRALQAPGITQRENADRARRAAMGVQGGERIVETSERNLADAASRADMQAILEGGTRGRQDVDQQMKLRGMYGDEQNRMFGQAGGMMGTAAPEDLKFGSYAQQAPVTPVNTTENAMKMWEMQQAQANAKAAASKGDMMSGLGSVVGGVGAGFYSGWNPAAMQAGASIGGSAGGLFDK